MQPPPLRILSEASKTRLHSTALHLAAERISVGALEAILETEAGKKTVNAEDNSHYTALELLVESRDMLESHISGGCCSCSCFATKATSRRWKIFRGAEPEDAKDELFGICGGFASATAKAGPAEGRVHKIGDERLITKRQFESGYLCRLGLTERLADDVWAKLAPETGQVMVITKDGLAQNKMNRDHFHEAISKLGRDASIWEDFRLVADIHGHNPMRVLELSQRYSKNHDTDEERVKSMLGDFEKCEALLLANGADPMSKRKRRHCRGAVLLFLLSPVAACWGAGVLAVKPWSSTVKSLGEVTAYPTTASRPSDRGNPCKQRVAVWLFLLCVMLGCWLLPAAASAASSVDARHRLSQMLCGFVVGTIIVTQACALWHIFKEDDGDHRLCPQFHARHAMPDPGSGQKGEVMSEKEMMSARLPSERYSSLHGWWEDGEPGESKRQARITVTRLKHSSGKVQETQIHHENPHHIVQPRHTYLPTTVSWSYWNVSFVLKQLWEISVLASLPIVAPDVDTPEHRWLPKWFEKAGTFLRSFAIELPSDTALARHLCYFLAVTFVVVWMFICGHMMLGLIARQRPALEKKLTAFAPDFIFKRSGWIETFCVGPMSMIVTKWLLRMVDCSHAAASDAAPANLTLDMDPDVECYKGSHTQRAAVSASLLIFYTLTTANFGPSFLEDWDRDAWWSPGQKDIRIRPTFVTISSFVKLISVCVGTLATSIVWLQVLWPVVGSVMLGLLA